MSRVSRTIFVRNLPYNCTKDKLEGIFSDYGPVKQCFVVTDKASGKSRGIGYVTYTLRDDAIKAKEQKVSVDGRRLLLDYADIAKKVKSSKKKKVKDEPKDTSDPESEADDDKGDEDDGDEEEEEEPSKKSSKKDKSDQEKMSSMKYHRAKIVLLSGLGTGLTEEKLNLCLQKLNVKSVAELKLLSEDSAHVKFKCIRDAKRAVNRLNKHEYKGSTLTANQLSKETANIPQKMLKKCRLIVRNLAFKCQEKDLRQNFEKFGDITEVKVPKNAEGQSLGFGFVQFLSLKDAKKAIDGMTSTKVKGRTVAVDWAIPKNKYESDGSKTQSAVTKADNSDTEEEEEEEEDEGSISGEGDTDEGVQTGKRKRDLAEDEGYSEEDDNDDDDDGDDDDDDDDETGKVDSDDEMNEEKSDKESDDDSDNDDDDDLQNESVDVDEGKTVFIRNLSYDTQEDKLSEFFEKYGDIVYGRVVVDFNTEHSKGMAFVKFKTREAAEKCIHDAGTEDIMLDGRKLSIVLAVSRQKSSEFNEKKKKEKKDNRNLYLAREGYVRPGTQAAVGLSDIDLRKRAQVETVKRQKLKDINVFVSTLRLCVRNIPTSVTDKQLKMTYLKAAQDKSAKITECRIMRDQARLNASGVAKSLGFGFISFTEHQHALTALRHTNNNPEIFGENKRLIVEFSLENRRALEAKEKRKSRQILKQEILKKNSDEAGSDRKRKIDKEKLLAVQKPKLSLLKLSEDDKKAKAKLPKGMPTHMGPKIRHKARQSQQVKKPNKSKKNMKQPWKNQEEGPARKKQKMTKSKKNYTDNFDKLVSSYKNKFMNKKKDNKWYE